jgi:hypothetical protein
MILSDADDRNGLGTNAISSRRVRFRLLAMRRSLPGYGPLRLMRRSLDCSRYLIYSAWIAIDNSRSLGASDPLSNAEQLNRAAHSLTEAADFIERATDAMQEANAALTSAPESDSFAQEQLAAEAKRMLAVAGHLNMVTLQLETAVASAVLLERAGHVADARPAITAPPTVVRPYQDDAPRLPLRHRRSVLGTIEDAIRRVCRGRAPPTVSLCPL